MGNRNMPHPQITTVQFGTVTPEPNDAVIRLETLETMLRAMAEGRWEPDPDTCNAMADLAHSTLAFVVL